MFTLMCAQHIYAIDFRLLVTLSEIVHQSQAVVFPANKYDRIAYEIAVKKR